MNQMNTVIILGSSRNDGNTKALVDELIRQTGWDLVDLNNYDIGYFDYQHENSSDDYLPLMRKLIQKYDRFVFATPVYWYAMSGVMKVFFDRFTDLLTIEKEMGRQLRGKEMAAVSCSNGGNLGEDFWLPFRKSASYLGMRFLKGMHFVVEEDITERTRIFLKNVQ